MTTEQKPIVYSCSGCSNLAQIAHDVALTMDKDGIAEMSCISGVIGNVKPIKRLAESGRKIISIDGCNLVCTKACLDACGIKADHYFDLSEYGFEKRSKEENSLNEACVALSRIYNTLVESGYSIDETLAD